MRRNRGWAAGFQSSDAAVDAVHVLYYNTKAALGNHGHTLAALANVKPRPLIRAANIPQSLGQYGWSQ